MKIYNSIGSKERFLEIFQGVNKVKLNENIIDAAQETGNLVEAAFQELISNKLNITQTNNQVEGDETVLEIIGTDDAGNAVTFKFRVNSNQTDQDDVISVDNATLIKFNMKSDSFDAEAGEGVNTVQDLNAKYGKEMIDVASEYGDFQSTEDTMIDDLYEDAVKLIDKVPYLKGTEQMQTSKAYGDQKPTNDAVRVNSPELEQYLSEMQEYIPPEGEEEEEDLLAMPPDFSAADMPPMAGADDGTTSTDPYDNLEIDNDVEQASPEEQALFSQAYDNLIAAGNEMPTTDQISYEVDRIQGKIKPIEKTRAIPKGAEEFWESETNEGIFSKKNKVGGKGFMSSIQKKDIIIKAVNGLRDEKGGENPSLEEVKARIKDMIEDASLAMQNETDYPESMGIGKEFKTVTNYPKPKKKYKKKQTRIKTGVSEEAENANQIKGGLADEKDPIDFNPQQIMIGMGVEMEHTDDPKIALEITMDHLMEIPDYYTRLNKMEKEAEVEEPEGVDEMKDGEKDEELTDKLLGYKSHNVGDEMGEDYDFAAAERDYHDKEDYEKYREEHPEEEEDDKKKVEIKEEDDFNEYSGEIGDRYQDGEGNQFTVRDKVEGGVTLQGQGGEKEIATQDIQFLKKL